MDLIAVFHLIHGCVLCCPLEEGPCHLTASAVTAFAARCHYTSLKKFK